MLTLRFVPADEGLMERRAFLTGVGAVPVHQLTVSGGETMTSLYNREFSQKTAVTVELPASASEPCREQVANVLFQHAMVRSA